MPDHLFISYATEDFVLAEWLTRKLTALGYRVWCDRFELLGGERFHRDIDKAIKEDTFRVIALLSKISIQKDGPTKERTLALNIGKERKIDFLIPLLLEPLSPSEFHLDHVQISPIFRFHQGWRIGLQQLVQKLDKIQTPQPLNNSFAAAADSLLPKNVLDVRQETLHSNILRVQRIPEVIKRFVLQRQPTPDDEAVISQAWPSFQVDQTTRLAFLPPPPKLCDKLTIMLAGGAVWKSTTAIDNVQSSQVVTNLIRQSMYMVCRKRGLTGNRETGLLHFPVGLLPKNKLCFTTIQGKPSYVLGVGQRSRRGSKYRYHLAPIFSVRRDLVDGYCVLLRIRILITDEAGATFPWSSFPTEAPLQKLVERGVVQQAPRRSTIYFKWRRRGYFRNRG